MKKKEYDIKEIIRLHIFGLSLRRIAKEVGGCSYNTIRTLINKYYNKG